jgi:hypothetical protein
MKNRNRAALSSTAGCRMGITFTPRISIARESISAWIDTLSLSAVPPPPPTRFHTLEPCRLFDTRESDGPIDGGGSPDLDGAAARSSDRQALAINLTVTGATDAGTFSSGSDAPPLNSSTSTTVWADAPTARSASRREFVVHSTSRRSVHLIIDVNGYFE